MQSTNIPSKIPLPFAYAAGGGYINPIPVASQIGITDGRASLHDGFPPDTFTPINAGGVPPFGGDFNGILNEITAIQQWQEAGGFFPFDPTFAATVNGYPKGAVIQSNTQAGYWLSTIENNSNNPDAGGAGWVPTGFYGLTSVAISGASLTISNLQAAYPIISLTGALTQNCLVILPNYQTRWIVVNNTTNAYTIQVKTASGTGVNVPQGDSLQIYGDGTNIYSATTAAVSSFNGRTGTVTLNATDVDNALGYVPYDSSNPAGYITASSLVGLGFGGTTWHDVTGSRASGVQYTNSRAYPIAVSAGGSAANSGPALAIYVNGMVVSNFNWQFNGAGAHSGGFTIVPAGATYQLNFNGSGIQFWAELY